MAFAAIAQLQRRRRQHDTLRRMAHDVDELLQAIEQLASERDLTTDELLAKDALEVRADRIAKSIDEAGR